MKVALITGGQPRFTPDFIKVLGQLKGVDHADLYVNLWESNWADSVEEGASRINKILPGYVTLKKLQIVKEPARNLQSSSQNFNELKWWYDRRIGQIHSLKLACDLIEGAYDAVIRIRPDGCLTGDIDLQTIDLGNGVVFCNQLMGANQTEPNDQFFIGTYQDVKFLCDLYTNFDKFMIQVCPNWENDVHGWALEYIIGTYLKSHGKAITRGSFNHVINASGKSAYTDKHTHLPIATDPTT